MILLSSIPGFQKELNKDMADILARVGEQLAVIAKSASSFLFFTYVPKLIISFLDDNTLLIKRYILPTLNFIASYIDFAILIPDIFLTSTDSSDTTEISLPNSLQYSVLTASNVSDCDSVLGSLKMK